MCPAAAVVGQRSRAEPLAARLGEFQTQVEAFDHICNTERPHQALPGWVTPPVAWEDTVKAEAPRPKAEEPFFVETVARQGHRIRLLPSEELPAGTSVRKLASNGSFTIAGVIDMVGGQNGFQHVLVTTDGNTITVTDFVGEILVEHTRAAPGTIDVGNGRSPGGPRRSPEVSPKS